MKRKRQPASQPGTQPKGNGGSTTVGRRKASLLNRVALAKAMGVVASTVSRWERDGLPSIKAGRGRETRFELRRCKAWVAAQARPGGTTATRGRLLLAQALEAEQRIAIKDGTLVHLEPVFARVVTAITRCRTKLLGLPRKAKAVLPHLTAKDVQAIDVLVRSELEELATEGQNNDRTRY